MEQNRLPQPPGAFSAAPRRHNLPRVVCSAPRRPRLSGQRQEIPSALTTPPQPAGVCSEVPTLQQSRLVACLAARALLLLLAVGGFSVARTLQPLAPLVLLPTQIREPVVASSAAHRPRPPRVVASSETRHNSLLPAPALGVALLLVELPRTPEEASSVTQQSRQELSAPLPLPTQERPAGSLVELPRARARSEELRLLNPHLLVCSAAQSLLLVVVCLEVALLHSQLPEVFSAMLPQTTPKHNNPLPLVSLVLATQPSQAVFSAAVNPRAAVSSGLLRPQQPAVHLEAV